MVFRKGPRTLPKPRRGARDLLGKLAGCPIHDVRREAMRRWLAAHPPENGARHSSSTSSRTFVSRWFPVDVAKAPFDNQAGSSFTVDDDLGGTARPIRRREKNAFLDACLPS